ncbi:MAG: molybdate ABC transporter substrate-binding protein [Mycobacteriales bacterium]
MNVSRRRAAALGAVLLLAGCAGCGKPGDSNAELRAGRVVVFSAASLTESFTVIANGFQARHPDVDVELVFGPSTELARQVVEGARADVFAAASTPSVAPVIKAELALGAPRVFARNRLQIAVAAGNPARIGSLGDLANNGVKFAQCAVEVPGGAAAKTLLDLARVNAQPVTYERDVKAVLAKVRLGEVDAGLVYRTDIRAESKTGRSRIAGVEIAESMLAGNDYPILAVKRAGDRRAAGAFVEFVLSAEGRAVLVEAGFDVP